MLLSDVTEQQSCLEHGYVVMNAYNMKTLPSFGYPVFFFFQHDKWVGYETFPQTLIL